MNLHWSRGYSFSELLTDKDLRSKFKCPGVYVHTDHRRERAAYVGKASGAPDLWLRQYTHYVHYIGGLYLIPSVEVEAGAYAWEPGPGKTKTVEAVFNRALFHQIVDLAFDYVPRVAIHLCPVETAAVAKLVERELLWALSPLDTTRGTKSPPEVAYKFVHHCAGFPELESLFVQSRPNNSLQARRP